jgi:hypothetical protein
MTNSLSHTLDRFAAPAILAVMVAGLPLGGIMFILNSIAI